MNISFPQLNNFNLIKQSKKINNSTNSIKYTKTLNQDTVSFCARKFKRKRPMPSSLKEKIQQRDRLQRIRKKDVMDQERLAILQREIDEEIEFENRSNAAFLYDTSLTTDQIEAEYLKHPEFVEVKELEEEFQHSDIKKLFRLDAYFGQEIVDMSYEQNVQTYEYLKEAMKGKISADYFIKKYQLPPRTIYALVLHGVIEESVIKVPNTEGSIICISEDTIKYKDNIEKLIPKEVADVLKPFRISLNMN